MQQPVTNVSTRVLLRQHDGSATITSDYIHVVGSDTTPASTFTVKVTVQ
jgi:hypothetical protein